MIESKGHEYLRDGRVQENGAPLIARQKEWRLGIFSDREKEK